MTFSWLTCCFCLHEAFWCVLADYHCCYPSCLPMPALKKQNKCLKSVCLWIQWREAAMLEDWQIVAPQHLTVVTDCRQIVFLPVVRLYCSYFKGPVCRIQEDVSANTEHNILNYVFNSEVVSWGKKCGFVTLEQAVYIYRWSGSSSTESAILFLQEKTNWTLALDRALQVSASATVVLLHTQHAHCKPNIRNKMKPF